MKKLIGLCFPLLAFASQIDSYKMGYTDGYEQGKRDGLLEGYRLAIEDFRKIYMEKIREYEEIEAGKLLIKESRVSYPRVYTTGSGRLVVEGCRLVSPVDDLLARIPIRDFQRSSVENGASANGGERIDLRPIKSMIKVVVKESNLDPESLQNLSLPVYRKEGDKYVIYFDDPKRAKEFCVQVKCESK